jgi:hypothetical protein
MINLIPPQAKKSLGFEYWIRVASVWLYLWAFAVFAAGCLMFPSYVLIGSQVDAYSASAEDASEMVENYEVVSNTLVRASQEARAVVDESRFQRFSDVMALIRELQGEAVQLSSMSLGRNDTAVNPVRLSGMASNREALDSFRDRLLAQPEVDRVDLPISNLANNRDIQFTITVTLASPETYE